MARRRRQTVDACAVLSRLGISRDESYHVLPSSKTTELHEEAVRAGYRKPKNANGSRARYFLARLQRQCK